MAFAGIPVAALDFYEDLENDNSKTFWTAHKQVYDDAVKAPLLDLAAAVADEFGPAKLFRPYRDVRFSKDKTLYKTQQGMWFEASRRYVHVSAAGLFAGGGYWRTSPAQVARLRRAAADDDAGPALERALSALRAADLEISGERISRVPAGFAKDHPRADLLRCKTITCGRDFGCPPWLATPAAQERIVAVWRAMSPVIAWLDAYVGDD